MVHIHWYPGHIAKAERKLKEQLALVDVVIEVLDARIPYSSMYPNIKKLIAECPRLILLNKADLVDISSLKQWRDLIKKETNSKVLMTSFKNSSDINDILSSVVLLGRPKIEKLMQKGLLERPARVMVVGMPNVGKSSVINKLIKKAKTKVGAKAGVTRQQQWVRINPKVELLDTPGIIPLKQECQEIAQKLAFVNSVGENAYDNIEVANELLMNIAKKHSDTVKNHYNLTAENELTIDNIALKRNWLVKNGEPDVERCAIFILTDFREGRLGKMILDDFPENFEAGE